MRAQATARRVRARRRCLTADDRRDLVNELVVLDCRNHEQGEIYATCDIALQNGVAHVPAPHRQAHAVALLEVAAAHDGPLCVAAEHSSARLHLVVEVGEASKTRERAEHVYDRLELPRVNILAVTGDVPPA